ncbi:unnamed protein product [Penicillium glandicola]
MGLFRIDFLALWLLLLRIAAAAAPVATSDGRCFVYLIQGYDTCELIAKAHDITEANIEAFNTNTWAWLGCDRLYQGDFICLSTGRPPMPMALPHATCGPQVPGTTRPTDWAQLPGLNPCPSAQCCAIWGECFVADTYCQTAGYRAPPAGPTATVKGATEAPTSKSTTTANAAAGKQSTTTGTAAKPNTTTANKGTTTTKANTTTTTTKKTTTTTKKTTATIKTTTTIKKATTTTVSTAKATTAPDPDAPWEATLYSKRDCQGDYYHLEGYNKKFLDDEGCLPIHGGLNSKFSTTNVTCKWWTNGGLTSSDCDSGTLTSPQSWIMKNAYCVSFSKVDCDCFDTWSVQLEPKGCDNRVQRDPKTFSALQCSIDGF